MAKIEIYSSQRCPYCVKAKQLLKNKGLAYDEIDVTDDDEARIALVEKSKGMRTVPQIFINNEHIGGCDDLYQLNDEGKLDKLVEV